MEIAECELGYTEAQVRRMLGDDWPRFVEFMSGQTCGVCDARRFNYETNVYEPTGCGPHGVVFYRTDVGRFRWGMSSYR